MKTINLEDIQAAPQEATDPELTIQMPDARLPVGAHKFGLTVKDDSGNPSLQAVVRVVIVDLEKPTAVVEVLDENGRPVSNNSIAFGKSFILSGKGSTDIGGGSIASYVWELL